MARASGSATLLPGVPPSARFPLGRSALGRSSNGLALHSHFGLVSGPPEPEGRLLARAFRSTT